MAWKYTKWRVQWCMDYPQPWHSLARARIVSRAFDPLRRRGASLAHGLLPRCCALCSLPLDSPAERRLGWCHHCAASLPGADAARCPICAERVTNGPLPPGAALAPAPEPPCRACRNSPPPFERTVALADYAPPLDRMILALKFGHAVALAGPLGTALAARIDFPLDLVLPVPLSAPRLAERGFNQAWLIARALVAARRDAVPPGKWPTADARVLSRPRHDPPQSLQPLRTRAANLRDAFSCQRNLAGLRVAIVDDVMTSGATLAAAAAAARSAGAAFVANIVAARTPRA